MVKSFETRSDVLVCHIKTTMIFHPLSNSETSESNQILFKASLPKLIAETKCQSSFFYLFCVKENEEKEEQDGDEEDDNDDNDDDDLDK